MVYHVVIRAVTSARRRLFPEFPQGWLLHLSDTPSGTFSFLQRLLCRTHPAVIVHTGDLVDDVKLELRPRDRGLYARHLARLLAILEGSGAEIHLTLGNHDDEATVRALSARAHVYPQAVTLPWGGGVVRGAHRAEVALAAPASCYLFGHDLSRKSSAPGDPVRLLNGLQHIHLISPLGAEVLKLRWPWGTEDARLQRRRCGM